jgi:ubiquinone/menaquinone biosynthesis C-methylase UbiE
MSQPRHASVRRVYDAVAEDYAAHFADELDHKPLDRALLAALIEQTEPGTPIADLGCGPGHVAAWLAQHGATAVGIDLSPEMVAVARRDHPEVEYRVGDLLSLPATDAEFGAIVAFYSVIHLEPTELAGAFVEMCRVLRPGGQLLVSFHIGTEVRHRSEWWGHEVDVDFRFLEPDAVTRQLEGAGFVVQVRVERVHYPPEVATRRCFLLALPR